MRFTLLTPLSLAAEQNPSHQSSLMLHPWGGESWFPSPGAGPALILFQTTSLANGLKRHVLASRPHTDGCETVGPALALLLCDGTDSPEGSRSTRRAAGDTKDFQGKGVPKSRLKALWHPERHTKALEGTRKETELLQGYPKPS